MHKSFYKNILFIFFLTIVFINANELEETKIEGNNENNLPTVSIHAEDTHLPTILSILAKESGYNIVTGPNVQNQNKLTIHLDDVPIDQAINLVIRAAGLSYEIVGTSILVANQAKLSEDVGTSPHVINLQYSKAEDIAMLLQNITKDVTIDPSGNKLLVSASPKKINEIREIVKEIDVPATQIMLEARLIEVDLTDSEEMGLDWERLAKTTIIFAEETTSQRLSQTSTGSLPTGDFMDGGLLPGMSTNEITGNGSNEPNNWTNDNQTPLPFGVLPAEMPFDRTTGVNPFGRQLTAFDVTLDLLMKDNKANILTNSQVVTVNGHEATIEMVDVIPYLASSGGLSGNLQVKEETVGVKLKILPLVNTDGYITTKITPEVSSITSWTAQGYPWTKKRTSSTTVRVKDGETIVIAGLVTTQDVSTQTKVPILWRIPIIGKRWFTHNQTEEKKTDLVIQVKPTIVIDNYSGIELQDYHKEAEEDAYDE
tara:strand:+ start:1179 stop:2630 length:1452 start_codon:yes stop_codon:yes gene_type:complete